MSRKDCGHTTCVLYKMKDVVRNGGEPITDKAFCSQCQKWLSPDAIRQLAERAKREIEDEQQRQKERIEQNKSRRG